MGCDAVEEPAIVADDDRASCEGDQCVFQRPQGVNVQIVGRFVEQEQVAPTLEQLGEMDPVPLAAGEILDLLLLVGSPEVEARAVGSRVHLAGTEEQLVFSPGNLFVRRLGTVERVSTLIHVGQLDCLADRQIPTVGLFLTRDHAKQRRLACAVGPDHPDDPAAGQREVEVLEEQTVAIALG